MYFLSLKSDGSFNGEWTILNKKISNQSIKYQNLCIQFDYFKNMNFRFAFVSKWLLGSKTFDTFFKHKPARPVHTCKIFTATILRSIGTFFLFYKLFTSKCIVSHWYVYVYVCAPLLLTHLTFYRHFIVYNRIP